jgi:hypothetical protein
MRINVELLYCELQAWEYVVARICSIHEGADGSELVGRLHSNSAPGATSTFEALLGERIHGLIKSIKQFRDTLA